MEGEKKNCEDIKTLWKGRNKEKKLPNKAKTEEQNEQI